MRFGARSALEDVDLSFSAGISVLLGPNGAGKTTFVNCASGGERPTAGTVTVCGLDPIRDRQPAMDLIGVLPQDASLPRRPSVLDVVAYAAWLKRHSTKESTKLAMSALESVGLGAEAGMPARKLSGGMQRRAAIATAIVHRPPVLILDEPMSGLDPAQRASLRGLIRNVAGDCCVLITTHILQDVPELADRVAVLTAGKVRFDGTVGQFAAHADSALTETQGLESAYRAIVTPGADDGDPRST